MATQSAAGKKPGTKSGQNKKSDAKNKGGNLKSHQKKKQKDKKTALKHVQGDGRSPPQWAQLLTLAGALAASVALVGCGSSSILETRDLGDSKFITTDAQQRVIINNEISGASITGLVDPVRMTCTEPSPDVATATATSFGAALSRPGRGTASFSAEHVEALAQLVERTASIQLLRDKMYQTCLAYANGAITGTTYTVVMSQLDKTILSLLLGETAGGAFGRSLAAIDGSAEGEARATMFGVGAAVNDIVSLTDQLATAQADVDTKAQLLDAANKAAVGKAADSPEARAATDAKNSHTVAVGVRDELLKRLQNRSETLANGSAETEASAVGSLSDRTDPLIAETLGQMQEAFLAEGLGGDSVIVACLSELGLTPIAGAQAALTREISSAQTRMETAFRNLSTPGAEVERLYEEARAERDGLLNGSVLTGRTTKSALSTFCTTELAGIVTAVSKNRKDIQEKRLTQLAAVANARLAVAQTETARAQAAQATAVMEALKVCQAFTDNAVKQACVAKLPGPLPPGT